MICFRSKFPLLRPNRFVRTPDPIFGTNVAIYVPRQAPCTMESLTLDMASMIGTFAGESRREKNSQWEVGWPRICSGSSCHGYVGVWTYARQEQLRPMAGRSNGVVWFDSGIACYTPHWVSQNGESFRSGLACSTLGAADVTKWAGKMIGCVFRYLIHGLPLVWRGYGGYHRS